MRERDGCTAVDGDCGATYTHPMPAGKSWRFGTAIYQDEAWLDNYAERPQVKSDLLQVSPLFVRLSAGGVATRTSCYYFGGQRVAMRQFTTTLSASWVYWIHGDHLGSASLTTDQGGATYSQLRYKPFGEVRWASGSTPTDRTFTGQRAENVGAVGSLMDFNARAYSPVIGRFISADSIVPQPGNPQSLNRYIYVYGNPLKYTDSTGHLTDEEIQALLGNDSSLYQLWAQYDLYWIQVLQAVQIGGQIRATAMNGELHIEGTGASDIRAVQYQKQADGTVAGTKANIWDWQGKGQYAIRNAGESDRQAAYNSDALFNSQTRNGTHTVLQPVSDYRGDKGGISAAYRGGRMVGQSVSNDFQWFATVASVAAGSNGMTAVGITAVSTAATGVLLSAGRVAGGILAKIASPIGWGTLIVDMAARVVATYNEPRVYSTGTAAIDINEAIPASTFDRSSY